MKPSLKILSLASLLAIVSCGGSSSGGNKGKDPIQEENQINQNETVMADGSNVQGVYAADIWPVNYNLQLASLGSVAVQRIDDDFTVAIDMNYAPRGTRIRQAIYYGRRCPNINDDLNKDAYIDIKEARMAMGFITIPLDSDLNSQTRGSYDYPVSSTRSGGYIYKERASFQRMFDDLKEPETDFSDDIMKLSADDGITLPGRVVLFQGLAGDVFLPDTVQGENGMSAHESLPVGCAVLWKVDSVPEILN